MRIEARFSRPLLVAVAFSLLLAAPAIAQVDTGTIRGTVKDASGGVLPGATVTITHEGQGFTLTGVTQPDGTYIFTPIRSGSYLVEIEFPGFRKGSRSGVTVNIQPPGPLFFSLSTSGSSDPFARPTLNMNVCCAGNQMLAPSSAPSRVSLVDTTSPA